MSTTPTSLSPTGPPPPLSCPIFPATFWIAENIDWLTIEPPCVGDPSDGAVGGVGDGGGEGVGGELHLLISDCYLVRMTICYPVNIMYKYGWVVVVG